MWNILIYDSDTKERETLATQIQQILDAKETLAMTILSFYKEGSLMNHVMRRPNESAMVFLDLSQNKKDGLQLGKTILEVQPNAQLIFLSAYDDNQWDVYEVDHVYGLRKPVDGKQEVLSGLPAAGKQLRQTDR